MLAPDLDAAWTKLKTEAPEAWVGLQSGDSYVQELDGTTPDQALAESIEERNPKRPPYVVPQPQEFELANLPPVIQWGGE